MKNKKMLIIIGGVVLVIAIVCLIVFLPKGKKEEKKEEEKKEEKVKILSEKEMVDAYGFSIKDAEEAVKKYFHSDVYEFSTEINEKNMYIVTVTDIISKDKYVYEVNPSTHSTIEITKEK